VIPRHLAEIATRPRSPLSVTTVGYFCAFFLAIALAAQARAKVAKVVSDQRTVIMAAEAYCADNDASNGTISYGDIRTLSTGQARYVPATVDGVTY
jgi:hypothetical protein